MKKHIQSHLNPEKPYCNCVSHDPAAAAAATTAHPLHPHDQAPADPEGFCPRCLEIQRQCRMHADRARHRMELEAESRRQLLEQLLERTPVVPLPFKEGPE